MDQDGSNTRQIYPPMGENSRFPREKQFMAWGPSGRDIAFVFDDALYLFNLDGGAAYRITQDDAVASRPSWAPYGAAITSDLEATELLPLDDDAGIKDRLPDGE
jgi:Tol biopolymer transport system component